MKLPEMKLQLESIDRCLEHHDNGKPYPGPRGMQTEGYKKWLAERDGFRSTRDKLIREIDAQEKLLANRPFAPVPPVQSEAAGAAEDCPVDSPETPAVKTQAPVEDGPADHLAGTTHVYDDSPPPPLTADARDPIIAAWGDIERFRAEGYLTEIVVGPNVASCTFTKPGTKTGAGATGDDLATVIRRAARMADADKE